MSEARYWLASPEGGAVVSLQDLDLDARGHQQGLGVYETLLTQDGRCEFAEEHFQRLSVGLDRLGIQTVPRAAFDTACGAVAAPGLGRLRVNVVADPQAGWRLLATWLPAVVPGPSRVVVSSVVLDERSALAGVKHTDLALYSRAEQEAELAGATDALLLNARGLVAEATRANLFAVFGKRVVTPSLASGCLPGVIRQQVLELADDRAEVDLAVEELLSADEVFLTSSIRGVQPVLSVAGTNLPNDRPVTSELVARLQVRRQK